jgi:Uma2 family endonuclease
LDNKKSTADKNIYTVVQPDILVVCDITKLDARGVLGAPDIVVEILSPGNSKKEMVNKFELYEKNGVLEYWIADPIYKTIQLFYLVEKKYQLIKCFYEDEKMESKLFKGLKVKVGEVFEG